MRHVALRGTPPEPTVLKFYSVKTSPAKRIRYARIHLRDCPVRNSYSYCSSCDAARRIFAEAGMTVERRGDESDGWFW